MKLNRKNFLSIILRNQILDRQSIKSKFQVLNDIITFLSLQNRLLCILNILIDNNFVIIIYLISYPIHFQGKQFRVIIDYAIFDSVIAFIKFY